MAPSNKSKRPTAKKLKQTLVSDFLEKVTEGRVKKEGQADTRSQQQADKGHVALQHLADDHEVDTPGQPQAESAVPDNGNGTASQPTSAALAGGDGVLTTQTAAASHPPRGGSRKRKRPAQRPILLDGGPETVGSGEYTVTVSVKILQEQSSVFFSGPIPAVDKSTESIRRFRDEASQYAVIQTSTVVRCADGKPVLYFIKGGMYASLTPGGDRELREKSISAIRELIDVYPPPRPDQADSRMQAEQRGIQGEKNKAFGRYMLAYWYPQGGNRNGPRLSSLSEPHKEKAMRSLVGYLQATAWEHDQIAAWISAIDPEIHEELHACYQGLGKETLKHLYQGPKACHSGLALLINRTEDPHKDLDDARDNWTSTNCWGAFQGGCVVYPELGVKVAMEPGDISLTRAAVLTHFVEEVEHGERFCHVRFTKENILRPTGKVYEDLAIPCPIKGCTRLCPSKATLKKHLRGPSDRARRAKRSPTFHWFGTKEVNQYIAEAMSALELRANEEEEAGESLAHDANEQVEDPPVVG